VPTFRLALDSRLRPDEAWRRVLDLRAHSRVIPLTTVTGDALSALELRQGSRFVARTALGPIAVDDAMVVDEITEPHDDAPGMARIHKEGRVVRGSIVLRVTPRPSGSRVEWVQQIRVRWVPALLDPVVAWVARRSYAATLRRLLAD